MKEYSPYKIAELILATKRNIISLEEEKLLRKWRDVSERNELLYNRLLEDSENIEVIEKKFDGCDYGKYYKECCKLIDKSKRVKLIKTLNWAAVLAIPLVLVVTAVLFFSKNKTANYQAMADICPGSSSALLILSDGEKVALGNKNIQNKILKDNIKVEADTLKYEKISDGKIVFNTIIIPRGGEYVLKLSDGTKIWLNAESELKYPVAFSGNERKVFLKGEGFFSVKKDKNSPFKVVTNDHIISVLGTEFCVRAYSDEKHITTTLESGKVLIEAGNRHVILLPGQQSNVSNSEMIIKDVNTELYTAWHKNKYVFNNQSLKEILNTLSRWYDIDVNYDINELGDIRFTGELIKYGNINSFLQKIEELEKVCFVIDGKKITVSTY